jgi:hypothetical protein
MARSQLLDPLQVYPFWLLDVGPNDQTGLPILTPLFGFSSITAPEITADVMDVVEGNWYFNKKVLKRFNVGNITLQRGVTWFDSDFWKWMIAAVTGDMTDLSTLPFLGMIPGPTLESGPTYRRLLLLIQYFPHFILSNDDITVSILQNIGTAGLVAGAAGLGGQIPTALPLVATGLAAAFKAVVGPFELAGRLPARAYVLKGCIPTRYKSGGDMEATSGAVSVAELELAVEIIEELSLAA